MMLRSSSLVPLLLLSVAYGCGGEDEPVDQQDASASVGNDGAVSLLDASGPDASDAGQNCRTFVSDSLIQHACFHELMGPYAERTAGASAGASGIDVNRAHTSFRVRLPARPEGGFGGMLTYQPRFAGAHAIFARGAELRVAGPSGQLAASFAHDTEICAALPGVAVYPLELQAYTLEVMSAQPDVVLVIEFMDEGVVADAYRVECVGGPRMPRDAAVFTLDASAGSDAGAAASPDHDGEAPAPSDGAVSAPDDASSLPASDAAAPGDADANVGDGGMCVVDPVLEHSCLHAMHGPFEAASAVDTGAAPPDISRPHTAWQMMLPAAGSGRFAFRPTMMGEYVFYLDRAAALDVASGGASVMPSYLEPVTGCVGISEARVFPLTGGARYDIVVGPIAGDAVTLIIESVQAFTSAWSERFEPCP